MIRCDANHFSPNRSKDKKRRKREISHIMVYLLSNSIEMIRFVLRIIFWGNEKKTHTLQTIQNEKKRVKFKQIIYIEQLLNHLERHTHQSKRISTRSTTE